MNQHLDSTILELLTSIRFRLEGGTPWLKIAARIIERDEIRTEATDAMLAQREFIERELQKLDAAITLCRLHNTTPDKGGA